MPQKSSQLRAISFLVCRTIFQDRQTNEYLLVSPFTGISVNAFPASVPFSLFILLTGEHEALHLRLQMRSEDGRVVLDCPGPAALGKAEPLAPTHVCWRDLVVQVSQPGRYALCLLAHDEELAQHPFHVSRMVTEQARQGV